MFLLKKRFLGMIVLFILAIGFGACGGGSGGDDGTGRKFWAQNSATEKYYSLRADLMYEGTHCDVYVEQGLDLSKYTLTSSSLEDMAKKVADEYDAGIYPKMIYTFSVRSIKNPVTNEIVDNVMDIADSMADGDGKLTILILDIQGASSGNAYVAGYFTPLNLYPNDTRIDPILKYSNECDMIYLNIVTDPGNIESNMTLAHEMQHMMCFATDVYARGFSTVNGWDWNSMDLWINEGLSSAAEYVYSGKHNQERIKHYNDFNDFKSPSLIPYGNNFYVWGERPDYILDEYATVYLFFQWLRLQSSSTGLLSDYNIYKAIISSKRSDRRAVLESLAGKGNYSGDSTLVFGTVMLDWFAANCLKTDNTSNGTNGDTPKHGYMKDPGLNLDDGVWLVESTSGTTSKKEIKLYPGEGVYSKIDTTAYNASGGLTKHYKDDSGSDIEYAGVKNTAPCIVDSTNIYNGGFMITYNTNTTNKLTNIDLLLRKGFYVADIVSTDTNFSLVNKPAFSAKATISSSQPMTSLNMAVKSQKPKKPHAISMGDMLRMNGHKDSGNEVKNFSRVK